MGRESDDIRVIIFFETLVGGERVIIYYCHFQVRVRVFSFLFKTSDGDEQLITFIRGIRWRRGSDYVLLKNSDGDQKVITYCSRVPMGVRALLLIIQYFRWGGEKVFTYYSRLKTEARE